MCQTQQQHFSFLFQVDVVFGAEHNSFFQLVKEMHHIVQRTKIRSQHYVSLQPANDLYASLQDSDVIHLSLVSHRTRAHFDCCACINIRIYAR